MCMTMLKPAAAALAAAALAAAGAASAQELDTSRRCSTAGEGMTRAKYQTYLDRFNALDESYAELYDDDIVFDHGSTGGLIHGPDAILEYYRNVWPQIDEKLSAGEVIIDNLNGVMAVELTTDLTATKDTVGIPGIDMKQGDRVVIQAVLLYGLCDGRMTWVRGAPISRTAYPAQ